VKPAFEFAPDLCTGCEACRVACGNENAGGHDTGWRQVLTFNPDRHPALPTEHLSLACNHCDVAACANGCPARAFRRDPVTGAVLIDADRCIGCRYCAWVCPYDAPRFDEQRGVMTKCTFCVHRLEAGQAPACVAACPTGALGLTERQAAAPEPEAPGLGKWGLGPALSIVPSRRTSRPEGLDTGPVSGDDAPIPFAARPRKIAARSEWSLVAFTLIVPALAAWFAGGLRIPDRAPPVLPFAAIAAVAFLLSASHLGRPARAWRALLGIGSSWLSREIAATGAFFLTAAIWLIQPRPPDGLGLAAVLLAVLACVAMDGVYMAIPRQGRRGIHGAEVTLNFLLLAGIAAGVPALVQAIAAPTLVPLAARWRNGALGMPVPLAILRVTLLLLAVFGATVGWPWTVVFVAAFASAAIDRTAFYETAEPSSPAGRLEAETLAALR
jgi:Fe-S-cluster-containing dehydrogenase component